MSALALAHAQAPFAPPILDALPAALRLHIEQHLAPRSGRGNRLLFFKGDPEDFIAFVLHGRVYKTLHEPGGREIIVGHALPGDLIGESALLDGHRRSFTAQLSPDCRIALLHRPHFAPLRANPDFMTRIHARLCRHLLELSDFVESACLYRLDARLARYLLDPVHEGRQEILLPANQAILAAMLNVSRPRLNIMLQKLQREGSIRLHRHGVTIEKPERLRAIISGN
jgi:CRP/FNR family transcriptional regulator, cyclic AMP receptor protein